MTGLFLDVLNRSISASWLVLAVLLLRFIIRKAPKWIHIVLWGMVAFRLLCPISIENPLSLIPSRQAIPEQILTNTAAYGTPIEVTPLEITPTEHPGNTYSEDAVPPADNSVDMLTVFAVLWSVGGLFLLSYFVISYRLLRRKVRTAVLFRENIFQSERVSSPFVLGLVRPRIYLPFEIDGRNLEYVISHEQAHIQRRDHWWKSLGFLLLTAYWFNPLMWLSYMLLCRDIELACDEKVIRGLSREQRADYSQALLACSASRRSIAACPVAFGEIGVKERVRSVLRYKKPAFWMIVAAAVVCVVVAICFLTDPESIPAETPSEETIPVESVPADPLPLDIIVWENADLDHDGEAERIRVRETLPGEVYELEIAKKDGSVLWSKTAGTAHTGWSSILLYQEGGEDYLIEYNPTVYQGMGSYSCRMLTLKGGVESEENIWTADFELSSLQITGKMRAFAERANDFLQHGTILLSTVEGEPVIGPKTAEEVPLLYPVRFFPESEESSSFAGGDSLEDFLPLEFLYASGAGSWGTTLTLYPDGHFEGLYEDSESIAAPEYPRGTSYYCEFSGKFGDIMKVSEYAYIMRLEELTYDTETDKEWIENEHRYIASEPYGISGGENFMLYLPGAPLEELDEEFLHWWPDWYLWRDGSVDILSSYGIRNVNTGAGFFTSWLQ